MGLFSDIYNTVAKFFRPQEEQGEVSKSVATNRLKLVLMQDRTNLTPKILEQMRGELIDLLSKYVELDKELLELNFEQEGEQVALMLSIPVIRARDEEEIEATLKKEAEADVDNESVSSTEENLENAENMEENGAEDQQNSEEVVENENNQEDNSQNVSAPEDMQSENNSEENKQECNTEA